VNKYVCTVIVGEDFMPSVVIVSLF